MSHRDYYTSERFIWDDLIEESQRAMIGLYEHWKKRHSIEDFLITWPAEVISAEDGSKVSGPCAFTFPVGDRAQRQDMILKTVQITKAYALLLVEQNKAEIQVILESRHGAKCWTIPIVKSGDVATLGPHALSTNGKHVGLLWSPTNVSA